MIHPTDSAATPHCHLRLLSSVVLGVLLVACVLSYIWTSESDPVVLAHAGVVTTVAPPTTYTLNLPLVSRQYCGTSVPSPFSIQIAALHQVTEEAGGDQSLVMLTEDEWLELYDTPFVTLTAALADSGADWSRVVINWSWIQPDPPPAAYVWGPYHDEKLRLVAEAGVKMIANVAYAPDWAADSPCLPVHTQQLDAFAQFLTDLVNHYKDPPYEIKHWELFNEPDATDHPNRTVGTGCWADASTDLDGVAYRDMLKVAYGAIKTADPEATVIFGGLAYDWFIQTEGSDGPFDRYFVDDVMKYGGGSYVDALAFHYFPDFHAEWERWVPEGNPPTCGIVDDGQGTPYPAWGIDLIAKTNHLRNRMLYCHGVNLPIWVTELGKSSCDNTYTYCNTDEHLAAQARYVIQGYARGLAAGAENITWYALTTPTDNSEQQLLFNDWTPKPAFYAYQTMTAELDGYRYARTWDVPNAEAYVFQTGCGQEEKTVAWGTGTLTFATAAGLRVVDRWGSETFVLDGGAGDADGVQNGAVVLQLSEEPVFVEVTSG